MSNRKYKFLVDILGAEDIELEIEAETDTEAEKKFYATPVLELLKTVTVGQLYSGYTCNLVTGD